MQCVHVTILSSKRTLGINNILSLKWPKAVIMVSIIPWLDFFIILKINSLPPLSIPPSLREMRASRTVPYPN